MQMCIVRFWAPRDATHLGGGARIYGGGVNIRSDLYNKCGHYPDSQVSSHMRI